MRVRCGSSAGPRSLWELENSYPLPSFPELREKEAVFSLSLFSARKTPFKPLNSYGFRHYRNTSEETPKFRRGGCLRRKELGCGV